MVTRRSFIEGAALAAGACSAGGCATMFGNSAFYGPTIRDRLWMWGHHVDSSKYAGRCAGVGESFKWPGRAVDQAEGCRLMGIPNNCVIRWRNLPRYPWGDYFEQFREMKRISFGIHDGGAESVDEKMRIAFEELQPRYPNLTSSSPSPSGSCWTGPSTGSSSIRRLPPRSTSQRCGFRRNGSRSTATGKVDRAAGTRVAGEMEP